jgi:hypothetical protein
LIVGSGLFHAVGGSFGLLVVMLKIIDKQIELLLFMFPFGPFFLKIINIKIIISGGANTATGRLQPGKSFFFFLLLIILVALVLERDVDLRFGENDLISLLAVLR